MNRRPVFLTADPRHHVGAVDLLTKRILNGAWVTSPTPIPKALHIIIDRRLMVRAGMLGSFTYPFLIGTSKLIPVGDIDGNHPTCIVRGPVLPDGWASTIARATLFACETFPWPEPWDVKAQGQLADRIAALQKRLQEEIPNGS